MDATLGEEQEQLRDAARDFLARECPMKFVRAMMEDAVGVTPAFWKQLAELGWTGLIVPEAFGGAGLGRLELAVLLEAMGGALVPGPFFSSVVLGAAAIAEAGDDAQRERILPGLAAGDVRATLALQEPGGGPTAPIRMVAKPVAGGVRLSGRKCFVPDGSGADFVVVAARRDVDGPLRLALVPRDADGLRARAIRFTDETRKLADLDFTDVFVPNDAILAGDAEAALARVLDGARTSLTAEMTGVADRALALSVAHAKTREQFGQPIGSFQAIQHKCADMLLRVENLRSAAWASAWAYDEREPDTHATACMAQAYAGEACSWVTQQAIQIHGGLGYTWEQDLHLYYKRAKADEFALGDGNEHRELVAHEVIDRG